MNYGLESLILKAEEFIQTYSKTAEIAQLETAYAHFKSFFKTLHQINDNVSRQEVKPALLSMEQSLANIVEVAPSNALLFSQCLSYLRASQGKWFPRAIHGWSKQKFRKFGKLWPEMLQSFLFVEKCDSTNVGVVEKFRRGIPLVLSSEDDPWLAAIKTCPKNPYAWSSARFAFGMYLSNDKATFTRLNKLCEKLTDVQGRAHLEIAKEVN